MLTRKYNDEMYVPVLHSHHQKSLTTTNSIRVSFSIADLNNMDPENDPYDDDETALSDEEEEAAAMNAQSGGANTKGRLPSLVSSPPPGFHPHPN